MTLKTNLHFHASGDEKNVAYDIYKGIDRAKETGFDVLAYTPHHKFIIEEKHIEYAKNKGILLIPGIEMEINKKHIVVLNCDKTIENVKNFSELADYKRKNPQILIIAPHPFVFSPKSLKKKLLENIDLFDAIELTVFSNSLFNFNKKAEEVALKYAKPLIANSDTHFLENIERGFSLINIEVPPQWRDALISNQIEDLEKFGKETKEAVFAAIKKGNFSNKLNGMNPFAMIKTRLKGAFNLIFGRYFT